MKFSGYACVTDSPYDMGWYAERVARGAFKKTLAEDPDVVLNLNHGRGGSGLPVARTTAGTLQLAEDDAGLKVVADLDDEDPDVQLVARKMKRGDLDGQMSFAFQATRQTWSTDYTERTITEASLAGGDVSIVTAGANPATSSSLSELSRLRGRAGLVERRARAAAVSTGAVVLEVRSFTLDGVRYEVRDANGDGPTCNRCEGEGMIALQGQAVTCPQCKGTGGAEGNATASEEQLAATMAFVRRNREREQEFFLWRSGSNILWRSKYTQSEIDKLGKEGHAFGPDEDGHYSFPIDDEEDLKNAIRAVGRGKAAHEKIRKYIVGRAKALGRSDLIPDTWNSDGSLKAS